MSKKHFQIAALWSGIFFVATCAVIIALVTVPDRGHRDLNSESQPRTTVTVPDWRKGRYHLYAEQQNYNVYGDASSNYYNKRPNVPGMSRLRIRDLIDLDTAQDASRLRNRLIEDVWKMDALPVTATPDRSVQVDGLPDFAEPDRLRRIQRLTVNLPHGLRSVMHVFEPTTPRNTVVIYHSGHQDEGISSGERHINRLVEAGYPVIAVAMPLKGQNLPEPPLLDVPGVGTLQITKSHDMLALFATDTLNPLYFFLHPPLVATNFAYEALGAKRVAMVGLSGGGWTTTVSAAVDPRIDTSVSVAGSLPFYLRAVEPLAVWGDWEQTKASIYRYANYFQLYVLASIGDDRQHLQILNQYDDCCFSGIGALQYAPSVEATVQKLNLDGEYDLFIDDSHAGHEISPKALQRILSELSRHGKS